MKLFRPHLFLTAIRMMETTITNHRGRWQGELKTTAQSIFNDIEQDCIELGLDASRASAKKIVNLLSKSDCSYEKFRELVVEIQERMIDEMSGPRFFSVSSQEANYYNNPREGWEKIIARFPDSVVDIEEARKCFAFSRYAAAVFHSVQVIEVGLIELGKFLQVVDPKSGWTAVAGALDKVIKKKHQDRTQFEQQNFAFLEQVRGTVEGLKNAWRNKISHTQGKLMLLTSDFNPEIAEEILYASRAFMRRLAEGLP
ncbi:MAG: hypothetical protein GEU76_01115 [Alphaproteobacteria bacterium]|nr:hypothetical protein [Alphaproteobacteria bacterium]